MLPRATTRTLICTRPFAADLDGDGKLDLVSGNSRKATSSVTGMCGVPEGATRVWADDVDGDGTLDLLVGDSVTLNLAAEGVEDAVALEKLAAWRKAVQEIAGDAEAHEKEYERLTTERDAFVHVESTGFVWLLLRKQRHPALACVALARSVSCPWC